MERRDLGLLVLLAACWGLSFVFIRIATSVIGPIWLVELRVSIASVTLLVYLLVTGQQTEFPRFRVRPGHWVVMALLSAAIPFLLISAAELRLSASLAAILNATVPLFTAVLASTWLGEPLLPRKVAGIGLGFVGVIVLVGGGGLTVSLLAIAAVGASLSAAILYAAGGVFTKREFAGSSSLSLTVGLQVVAALLVAPLALATGRFPAMNLTVFSAVVGLGILCTAFAYLIYFYLLQKVGPTQTLSVTFLVPVFGLVWSFLLLGEPIAVASIAGLGLILVGVGLVTRR